MPPLEDLNKGLQGFRNSTIGRIVGVLLAFVIAFALLAFAYTICFTFLIVALVLYGVPYYFGLKDKKRLAVVGLVLLIVLGVSFGLWIFNQYMGYSGQKNSSANGVIQNATVAPYRGSASTVHEFSALITNSSYDNITLIVQNAWVGSGLIPINTTGNASVPGGTMYYFNTTLANGLYLYRFNASVGNTLNSTAAGFGPIDLTDGELLGQLLTSGLLIVLLQIGILFFLFLLLSTITGRSRRRAQEKLAQKQEEKPKGITSVKDKFVCSECGADVPADASECPQCGEKFEGERKGTEKETDGGFFCTECGATVKEEDKKCWNCGKEFEN